MLVLSMLSWTYISFVSSGQVQVNHVPAFDQLADMLTKQSLSLLLIFILYVKRWEFVLLIDEVVHCFFSFFYDSEE